MAWSTAECRIDASHVTMNFDAFGFWVGRSPTAGTTIFAAAPMTPLLSVVLDARAAADEPLALSRAARAVFQAFSASW